MKCRGIRFRTEHAEYYRCSLDGRLTTQILGWTCPLCNREIESTDADLRSITVSVETRVTLPGIGAVTVPEDHRFEAVERES